MNRIAEVFENLEYGPAPEDAEKVRAWLRSKGEFDLFIGGRWRSGSSGARVDAVNPATGERLAGISVATPADVDLAVQAATQAFADWSARTGHQRARVLYALARLIQKTSRFLAVLETLDNGKPIRETRDVDVPLAARHFYHHAGWAQLLAQEAPGRRPIGVAGQIIPWNFPLLMLAWKVAPALACGATVVLKPAEDTSLTALYFAELCDEAGVPPGVVNIVTGGPETGEALVDHPGVGKIAFTGSTEVGRLIRTRTAGSGKRLSLELGGKSPFVVLEDADLDSVVEGLVDGIWFNQGEVCCAGARLLVEEGASARLIEKIRARLSRFRIGDPLDKSIDMGALTSPAQQRRVTTLVDQAVAEGATAWRPQISMPESGCYYSPTLLTDLGPGNVAWREEIFGPVLSVMSFRSLDEAVQLANNSRYGLAASVWSNDINRALELAARIKAGVVWINGANQFDAAVPFGGVKQSGFGREGGREGLEEYLASDLPWDAAGQAIVPAPEAALDSAPAAAGLDQSPKNYVGGRQTRADGGATLVVRDPAGRPCGRVPDSNRKDVRDAVEAALAASSWPLASAHARAQILYFIAENLDARAAAFSARLEELTGAAEAAAAREVQACIERLFAYAGWADKFEGRVHSAPGRQLVINVREPLDVIGMVCPDAAPLLALVSLFAPAMAMGARTVIVASERFPLLATDFVQVLGTSDVPAGVLNILTGARDPLALTLAQHDGVDSIWVHGSAELSRKVEAASAGNLKRVFANEGRALDWFSPAAQGEAFLRQAVQPKSIWAPWGG